MEHHGANPAPAGVVALCMACFTFFAVYSGNADINGFPLLACWMLGAFVIQFVTALKELDHGNQLGGCVFLYFSGFFCLATAFSLLTKWLGYTLGFPVSSVIEGWAWCPCTIALILWTPAYLKTSNGVMGILVMVVDVALVFLFLQDMGLIAGAFVKAMIAYPLLIAGILGLYMCSAIILNTAFGKTVLALPGPLMKDKAAAK